MSAIWMTPACFAANGEVSDCCLTCAHLVCADEGHTDLHCGPPGGGSTIAGPADGCGDVHCLPHRLANSCLQLCGHLGREELVEVQDELGLEVVCHLVVAREDLDVTVVHERRVGLNHVFLNNGCTGHGVVQHVEVLVDGLGGDFLAEALL